MTAVLLYPCLDRFQDKDTKVNTHYPTQSARDLANRHIQLQPESIIASQITTPTELNHQYLNLMFCLTLQY